MASEKLGGVMIKHDYSPCIRAVDYKVPKYAWFIYETS